MKLYNTNYTYPVSIILKKTDGFITRELITNKFKEAIKEYFDIDHEVIFENISRSTYNYFCDNDRVVLDYKFSSGEIPEIKSSVYDTMLDMCESFYTKEPPTFDTDSAIHRIMNGESNYTDLSELQIIYIGMKYDEARGFKDNEWDVLKFILKNKVKDLFKNRKDGTYHEVKLIEFKLDKLLKFNKNKHDFVTRRLKRNGKTLTNFSDASLEWNKQYKIKLNLDRNKASMELKTDLALSGLEDDIV
jgi:hypothetical protein